MFKEEKDKVNTLIDNTQEYIKTREELLRLIVVEKASNSMAGAMSGMIIFSFYFFFFVFFSLTLAFIITEYTGNAVVGFGSIALLYLLIATVLYVKKDQWLKHPLMNNIISNLTRDTKQ